MIEKQMIFAQAHPERATLGAAARRRPSRVSAALRSCSGGFAAVALFSGFVNVLMLTGPIFMLQVYDRVLASRSIPTLVVLQVRRVIMMRSGLGPRPPARRRSG